MHTTLKLDKEAKVWVKRTGGQSEVIQVMYDLDCNMSAACYGLYTAFEQQLDYIGRILFDADGYWIYDGNVLTISEQEQVAKFIINYTETF